MSATGEPAADRNERQEPVRKALRTTERNRPKRQPTGDYPVGYCRTPESTRFKKGNRGGPGRTKGARSQNTIIREELNRRVTVRIEGKERSLSQRELAVKMFLNKTFEGKEPKLLLQAITVAQQLFPDVLQELKDPLGDSSLDQQMLASLLGTLAIGEPTTDGPTSLSDLEMDQPDLSADFTDGDWDEDPEEGDE